MLPQDYTSLVFGALGVYFSIIATLAAIRGVLDQINKTREADPTRVCSDRDVMHVFATKNRGRCTYLFRPQAQTDVPVVPSLEKLLSLGDDLFYTSKVFDQASPPASPKEATWVWLYNTILEEVFRTRHAQGGDLDLVMKKLPSKKTRMRDRNNDNPALQRYIDEREERIPEKTRQLWEERTRQGLDDETGLVRCTRLFSGWQSQFRLKSAIRRGPEDKARLGWFSRWKSWMGRKITGQPQKDVEYLPRWMPPSNDTESSGPGEGDRQAKEAVVWSVSRSECAQGEHQRSYAYPEETPFHSPVRVIAEKPYIQISREQLYSLALSLGGPLHWDQHASSYRASAAFGIDITVEYQHREGFWRVRLERGSRRQRHPQTKGSGYSILFAKHMACGLLPFERSLKHRERIKAVYVSPHMVDGLRKGKAIQDQAVNMYDELEFISQLPSSQWTYLWAHCGVSDFGPGGIGKIVDRSGKDSVGFWWDAVCGIAFGGLVPQTTAELKEAVQFTMSGLHQIAIEEDDPLFLDHSLYDGNVIIIRHENALEYLENKLDDQYHVDENRYEKLFGDWVAERETDASIDYAIQCGDTRDAAAVFGKYQTVLERITALCRAYVDREQTSADKVDAVFSATRELVKKSYDKAVSMEWSQSHLPEAENISRKLGEVLLRIADTILPGKPCKLPDGVCTIPPIYCAWIAACIISAWADQVPVIHVACTRPTSEEKKIILSADRRSVTDEGLAIEGKEIQGLHVSERIAMADLPSVMQLG